MQLFGKCAIVTGGANGIGKALVEFLVNEGANVIVGDVAVEKGVELERKLNKDGVKVVFCQCDVRLESNLTLLFQKAELNFGGAQIMVNNAGISSIENIQTTTEAINTITDINFKAVIKGTSLAIQHFNQQKLKLRENESLDFCVITLSSAAALTPIRGAEIYSSTKKAVMYFTQSLWYLKNNNIRVNCVLPCFAKTNMTEPYLDRPVIKKLSESLGGLITITDIVTAIHTLITDTSRAGDAIYIKSTGTTLLPRIDIPTLI